MGNLFETFKKKKQKPKKKDTVSDYVQALLAALFLAIIIRGFVFEPFKIPSESMVPTLMIGDHIFVKRYAYGLRVPFTKYWLAEFDDPKKGDVIVFTYPHDDDVNYIKRVVGVPGDKISMKDGQLFVNGKKIEYKNFSVKGMGQNNACVVTLDPETKSVVPDKIEPIAFNRNYDQFQYKVEDIEGHKHLIQRSILAPNNSDFEEFTVPPRQFFVLGDNRDQSQDSRFWGYVPREYLKGKAIFIWLSLNSEGTSCPHDSMYNWIGKIFGAENFPSIRWDRFGKEII